MKLILSIAVFLSAAYNSYGQGQTNGDNATCTKMLTKYKGPHNTDQLTKLLEKSTNPILVKLDPETKNSLINLMRFDGGQPLGLVENDVNIEKLNASPSHLSEILSAIFGAETIVSTYDNKPKVINISIQDFMAQYKSDPIKYAFRGVPTWCYNCRLRGMASCCEVSSGSCWDEVVSSDNTLYRVGQ